MKAKDTLSALDDYVNREDDTFSYEIIDEYDYGDNSCYMYVVNVTTQTWLTEEYSSQPVWWHFLAIAVPNGDAFIHKDAGFMYITGGSLTSSPPGPDDDNFNATCLAAREMGAVGALLRQVPNQPIVFPNDPEQRERTEDAAIAFTWRMFLDDMENPGPDIILQFPMTKSAVRAMDVITEVAQMRDPESDVQRFVTSGGSKRGWITWLTACVDQRIVAIIPIVLSCLNTEENFMHHQMSMGGWSWVLNDYYEMEIFYFMGTDEIGTLFDLVDPVSYRSRLLMPKMLISTTGDEFFLPDDSHYFWDSLPDPKYLMMIENTNHGLVGAYDRAYFSAVTLFLAVIEDHPIPTMQWNLEQDEDDGSGYVEVITSEEPFSVTGWSANTIDEENRRDFRWTTALGSQNVTWFEGEVEDFGPRRYRFDCEGPWDEGTWTACFINVKFDFEDRLLYKFDFTTEVNYMPEEFGYEACTTGEECQGLPLV